MAPLAPTIGTRRSGLDDQLQQGGGQAAEQVEHQVAAVAQAVLDVVAEDPQEQHVAEEVADARMDEHRGQDGVRR